MNNEEKRRMKTSLGEFEFTLTPRSGQWKYIGGEEYRCPFCGDDWYFSCKHDAFNFCPECGADLRKGGTENEK